ncbi:MAG: ATPase domain-containing protein [archaeon]
MKRIQSGIPGLDGLIEGGFPHPSSILLTGPTGSAKTVLGLQFLYKGASELNEPGFMVDIAGYSTTLQWYSEKFSWDIAKLQQKGKLVFSSYDPIDFEKFEFRTLHSEIIVQLGKIIDQIGAKRVVIDSITPLGQSINDQAKFRTLLYYLSRALKDKGCTTLFIAETRGQDLTQFGVEQHVMDGVLEMSLTQKSPAEGVLSHTIMVRKMLATEFPIARYLVDFGESGVQLATGYY